MKKLKVVGEWIYRAKLFELKDHSSEQTDNCIIENEDFQNNYWAIIEVDEDGCYDNTVEDDFNSAEEAWKRYDELTKENKNA